MSRRVPAIMIQGTGSNVGKSLLVAGLCRAFVRQGLRVRPFKPQNMSNNAAAVEGGEIGRAQALQARAAMIAPNVHMNPVLLKPESNHRSQIIVQGKRFGQLEASAYRQRRVLLPFVLESFDRLSEDADLIIVEGAGSPAETNLRQDDIANMGFATAAEVPVILAGDIDRGGVIASLVGTHAVLCEEDRARIRGFLINKFRGDARLFADGAATIESLTGWPSLGVVPWFAKAHMLPAEDALDLASSPREGAATKIVVPLLPRIANFDDLDPLRLDSSVDLRLISAGTPLPLDADLIVIPGSKATIADLAFLREQGWHIDIAAHVRRGGSVLGLCGGYQMLGDTLSDPDGIEGVPGAVKGLGLLHVDTILGHDKTVGPVKGVHIASGLELSAYEIHLGSTSGHDTKHAPFLRDEKPEGAASADGRIIGTYLHGLFAADAFREAYLRTLDPVRNVGGLRYENAVDATLDALADHAEAHLDLSLLLRLARERR